MHNLQFNNNSASLYDIYIWMQIFLHMHNWRGYDIADQQMYKPCLE